MLTCKLCEEKTTMDELIHHPDIEPETINDYIYCPHCKECGDFTTSDIGDVNYIGMY